MEKTYESLAKINLFLKVTGKRPNGYHEIISIFQKISLLDTITFKLNGSSKISLQCDHPNVPVDGSNLIVKAAEALRKFTQCGYGADITLKKNIPVAAGLGGGSSNSATTLVALNELWGLDLSTRELEEMAFKLGADVPFFLNSSLALVEGAGERVTPLAPRKSIPILLVNPGFAISAKDAYQKSNFNFNPVEPRESVLNDMESGEPARIAKHLMNDLQPWALKTYPELKTLKNKMESLKPAPLGVLMSGSGPTLFATYDSLESCNAAKRKIEKTVDFVSCEKTVTT